VGLFPATIGHKDPPVAVINETMARRFWPNESALGKRIRDNDQADRQWHEVIGVVRDVTYPGHFGTPDADFQPSPRGCSRRLSPACAARNENRPAGRAET
jgi:hypothetical protein